MERRSFILGVGSFFVGACASRTPIQKGVNPYRAALQPNAPASAGGRGIPAPPGPGWHPQAHAAQPASAPIVRCGPGGAHYTIQPGDTLSSISQRFGVPCSTICQANQGAISARRVAPGRLIWLPGANPALCRPTAAASAPSGAVAAPGARPARVQPAPAPGGGFRVVARRDWGAQALKTNYDPMNGVRRITLHHTDEVPSIRARGDREIVAAIQRYHRNNLGWADIGYHYLIGRDGLVYEGRSVTAQGAHSGGANNIQNLGIAMIGNFNTRMPSAKQMHALQGFLADRQRAYRVGATQVHGHRDLGPTICPGSALYGWLKQYKRNA